MLPDTSFNERRSWIFSGFSLWLLAGSLVAVLVHLAVKRWRFIQRVNAVPGDPAPLPLIGNALTILRDPEELFGYLIEFLDSWRTRYPVLRFWAGPFPVFLVYTAEASEILLGSNKLIDKCREYKFLHPWLSTGLLTSTGNKWHSRRKMLTPAFHFKILEDFVDVFNEQSQVLVEKLRQVCSDRQGGFDVFPYVTRCALDIICDTAMGRHVGAQNNEDSEYVRAVCRISRIVQARQIYPWLQPDFLFNLTSMGREHRKCLEILHGFTNKVIQERKIEHANRKLNQQQYDPDQFLTSDDNANITKKQRHAFLDLLIIASKDGLLLSDEDIREEVDTFMFEGHDTTAAALSWCLHLIGTNPDVQEMINEELTRVFGDSDRPVSMKDLNELKYLECCIKEALRLYPSVPVLGRTVTQDTAIHGYVLPAGTTVALVSYALHRDPVHFPSPEQYMPERFYQENSRGRHPYSYVPFSAGPRNCIGQKFAMMEEKVVLSTILRHFHVESLDKRENIVLLGELILRPRDGVTIRLTPKVKTPAFVN